jgi:hypothetical protein
MAFAIFRSPMSFFETYVMFLSMSKGYWGIVNQPIEPQLVVFSTDFLGESYKLSDPCMTTFGSTKWLDRLTRVAAIQLLQVAL